MQKDNKKYKWQKMYRPSLYLIIKIILYKQIYNFIIIVRFQGIVLVHDLKSHCIHKYN